MNKVLKFPKEFAAPIEETLKLLGLVREDNPNVLFSYKGKGLKVVFYPTGTLLIQGKGDLEDIAETIVKNLSLETGYIGTDEAGKGDLFGPLVVCGFFLSSENKNEVLKLGVRDSKTIPYESLKEMAERLISLNSHRCLVIKPSVYNRIYKKFENLNKILSLAHASVIDSLFLETASKKAIVDKFMKGSYIDCFLNAPIEVKEETKAEKYPAVAAASVLARYLYLKSLKELSKKFGINLPAGSGEEAKRIFRELRVKFEGSTLGRLAKLHFRV